jgi:hypothetical protein
MTIFNHHASDGISSLIATLDRYAEAGIDPAFDGDMEELDWQFAQLRLTFDHTEGRIS